MKGLFAFEAEPFEFEAYGESESEFTFRPEPFPWPPESEMGGRGQPQQFRLHPLVAVVPEPGDRPPAGGGWHPGTGHPQRGPELPAAQGLIVDGIVGPQTEAKLRTLTGTQSLGSAPVSGSVPVRASVAPPSLPSPCGSPGLLPCPKPAPIDHFAEARRSPSLATKPSTMRQSRGSLRASAPRSGGFLAYGVIRIIGHTSAEGSPESNKALAQARADQVTKDLLENALLSQGLAVSTPCYAITHRRCGDLAGRVPPAEASLRIRS